MKPKTFEEHRECWGGECPYCRSGSVDWGSMEWFDNAIYQEAHCLDCDARYEDVYELDRYCGRD